MTPRKSRPRPSHGGPSQSHNQAAIAPSDIENDSDFPPPIAPLPRTNTELNLSVLRRHHAPITSILSIAPSAQIYTYIPESSTWNKTELEGTLFVCSTQSGYCVVVLNRRGLENLVVDLGSVENVEVTEEFLMVGVRGVEEEVKVLGFFIHKDRDETREDNCRLIREKWEEVRGEGGNGSGGGGNGNGNGAESGVGRRLSLSDLFGGQVA